MIYSSVKTVPPRWKLSRRRIRFINRSVSRHYEDFKKSKKRYEGINHLFNGQNIKWCGTAFRLLKQTPTLGHYWSSLIKFYNLLIQSRMQLSGHHFNRSVICRFKIRAYRTSGIKSHWLRRPSDTVNPINEQTFNCSSESAPEQIRSAAFTFVRTSRADRIGGLRSIKQLHICDNFINWRGATGEICLTGPTYGP